MNIEQKATATEQLTARIIAYLRESGRYSAIDDEIVNIYADAYIGWLDATERLKIDGDTHTDKNDEQRKSPYIIIQRNYAELVAKYAAMLGISPQSRKRLNITADAKPAKPSIVSQLRPIERTRPPQSGKK